MILRCGFALLRVRHVHELTKIFFEFQGATKAECHTAWYHGQEDVTAACLVS